MNFEYIYQIILKELSQVYEKLDMESVRDFMDAVQTHDRIFAIGVGREGMATRAFCMRLMHMGKEVHWIWDDTTPNIGDGDLLIATAGDGCIGHIHSVCQCAKDCGANVYMVTGSPNGRTAKEVANSVLFVPAAAYRGTSDVVPSIQPMGNLFEQSLFILFDIIVMMMVNNNNNNEITFESMELRHRNVE